MQYQEVFYKVVSWRMSNLYKSNHFNVVAIHIFNETRVIAFMILRPETRTPAFLGALLNSQREELIHQILASGSQADMRPIICLRSALPSLVKWRG